MLTLNSPAKINLFLRILYRRPDGYHELASLFQAIDLCDKLHVKTAQANKLTCTDPSLPIDSSNLVNRALELFSRKTGIKQKFEVHLEKNIPQQAGLGGGSSNAATTLWACNQLCGKPAAEVELAAWGVEIGSDIPFFLSQGTAYCTGRGEKLRFLDPLPETQVWIIKPEYGLSTPHVYKALNVASLPQRDAESILSSFLQKKPQYFNDLESAAFAVMPELMEIKSKMLKAGFSTVLLSGSGSSFFCIGEADMPNIDYAASYCAHFINRPKGSWF